MKVNKVEQIAKSVALQTQKWFDKPVSYQEILNPKTRYRENVVARDVWRQILYNRGFNVVEIAKLGRCDHSSVVHSMKKIRNAKSSERNMYDEIFSSIPKSISGELTHKSYVKTIEKKMEELESLVTEDHIRTKWVRVKMMDIINKIQSL